MDNEILGSRAFGNTLKAAPIHMVEAGKHSWCPRLHQVSGRKGCVNFSGTSSASTWARVMMPSDSAT